MRHLLLVVFLAASPLLAGSLDQARTLMDEGRFDEARPLLERGVKDPAIETESLSLLVDLCNFTENFQDGIRYGEQLVERLPESSDAHFKYAVALRTKMSIVNKMKAMFVLSTYKSELRRARELDPSNLDAREEEIGFLLNAPGFAGGDKDRARELIQEMKSLDWRRGTLLDAQTEMQIGDPERGIDLFGELLEKNPEDARSRNQLAFALQSQKRWKDADREFGVLADGDDERLSRGALYQRARTRIFGEYEQEQAIVFLERYIELLADAPAGLPSLASAYYRTGDAQAQLGRIDDARRSYERALSLEPKMEAASRALENLPRSSK